MMNRNRWIGVYLLAGIAALVLSYRWQDAPLLSNDGYQYLDAASHFAAGKCLCVEIAHFDEQVTMGRMPVPFTHFAPGYPLLIAAISRAGATPEGAGYIVSATGFLLTIWLIWELALTLRAKPVVVALLSPLWIFHEAALTYAASVGTDSMFTAALAGICALMARDSREDEHRPVFLLALGAVAGSAFWLRYAGLFLLFVAALYIVWRAWRSPKTRFYACGALAIEGLLVATVLVRNILEAGSWRGGFTSGGGHSLRFVLTETAKAVYHLVFGDRAPAGIDFWTVLFALALVAACSAWWKVQWRSDFNSAAVVWSGILVAAYTAGIMETALTTIAWSLNRYIVPLYPVVLAGLAAVFSIPATRRQVLSVAAMALSVVAVQSRSLSIPPPPAPHLIAAADLQQHVESGVSARQWLLDHVPPSSAVVSVNGQAMHYLLQRPTVSVIEPEDSSNRMDDTFFHAVMKRFSAHYLVVFPGEKSFATSPQDSIPFLHGLISGDIPHWLNRAASTRNTAIFECRDCVAQ